MSAAFVAWLDFLIFHFFVVFIHFFLFYILTCYETDIDCNKNPYAEVIHQTYLNRDECFQV